jgi:S-disulfanyl-L-cysteine oxidoreductase SoxD
MMKRSAVIAALAAWTAITCVTVIRGQETRSVWDGVYTAEQAKRGEALYGQYCASCHGGALLGAEEAPALTGFEFGANWSGLTLGDLFERIRMSMPADDPGKVSAQQKADIVAHMLKVGGFPAGPTELPRDQQVLTQIKYLATKP